MTLPLPLELFGETPSPSSEYVTYEWPLTAFCHEQDIYDKKWDMKQYQFFFSFAKMVLALSLFFVQLKNRFFCDNM